MTGTLLTLLLLCILPLGGASTQLVGVILDPQGAPVSNAHIRLIAGTSAVSGETRSDGQGNFQFASIIPGTYRLTADAPSFDQAASDVSIPDGQQLQVSLRFQQLVSISQSVTVLGEPTSVFTPDSSERVVVHDQVLDANPGRPGAPISIPGLPIETASGGIKAPQYFAPGVAGDHGEPIAQFFQIGNFIYPNNLPANAHGSGYSDPNFLIAPIIDGVTVDGGAFNVREGNPYPKRPAKSGMRSRRSTDFRFTSALVPNSSTSQRNRWETALSARRFLSSEVQL
jgi:hypothetical protein